MELIGGPLMSVATAAADFSNAIVVQGHLLEFYGRRTRPRPGRRGPQARRPRLDHMLRQPLTPARVADLLDV